MYSTSYGEQHGYNSRRALSNSEFRNRYMNPVYNGSAGPGNRPQTVPANTGSQILASATQSPQSFTHTPRSQQGLEAPRPVSNQRYNRQAPTQSFALTQPESHTRSFQAPPGYEGYLPKSHSIVGYRPRTPPLCRPGLTRDNEESKQNFGKYSTSRRLPERERLRYHVPGYMGFVKNIQFLHGDTYGRTTRKCILAPGVVEN